MTEQLRRSRAADEGFTLIELPATAVHYANTSGTYPATLTAMTGTTPSELDLPTGGTMAADGLSYTANGWTLTMTAGTPPSFACS